MTYRGADPTQVMGRRIGAYLIDLVIVTVVFVGILLPMWQSQNVTAPSGTVDCVRSSNTSSNEFQTRPSLAPEVNFCFDDGDQVSYIPRDKEDQFATTIGLVVAGTYLTMFVVIQGLIGGSPGKLLLGLRVVKDDGSNAGLGRCFVRTILLPIDTACCAIVGLLTAFNSQRHRRVGDMVASTIVIGRADQDALVLARSGHTLPGRQDLAAQQWTGQHPQAPTAEGSWDAFGGIQLPGDGPSGPPSAPPVTSATPPAAAPTHGDGPTWDPARNAYIQYDQARGTWMQFDDGAKQWKPIDS